MKEIIAVVSHTTGCMNYHYYVYLELFFRSIALCSRVVRLSTNNVSIYTSKDSANDVLVAVSTRDRSGQ